MKKKELKDLREKGAHELNKILNEKRVGFVKNRLDLKAGREKNLKKVKNLKRDIAQILTVIREKELIKQESGRVEEQEAK